MAEKPYYQDEWVTQYHSDALTMLRGLESDSIDLLCTDPPYGISFMGKEWDKALPDKRIWQECFRVLKDGAFAFVMSIPRSDCQARMVIALQDVGFRVDFTPIYWAYASGFPKAQNIGKAVDKRLGAEREVIGRVKGMGKQNPEWNGTAQGRLKNSFEPEYDKSVAATPQAKALDGSYGGFQPKPAVEVIIVAMKPLSEKTYVDQALKNRKGITWLDDGRIPYENEDNIVAKNPHTSRANQRAYSDIYGEYQPSDYELPTGRFPANLLVSDDVLNDGKITRTDSGGVRKASNEFGQDSGWNDHKNKDTIRQEISDSGSFSRYFDLDKWAQKTFPFLIVPKASKSEKNKGLGDMETKPFVRYMSEKLTLERTDNLTAHKNDHPTCKPVKLMSYLITLGSREGDTVLDPFLGSGTTALACKLLNRHCIGIEIEEKYCEIATKRCRQMVMEL